MPDEIDQKLSAMQAQIDELLEIKKVFEEHKHLGNDGSKEFDGDTSLLVKELAIAGGGTVTRNGYTRLPFTITDAQQAEEAGSRVVSTGLVVADKGLTSEQIQSAFLAGKLVTAEDLEVVQRSDWDKVNYVFTRLIQEVNGEASGSLPPLSFFVGDRTPYIVGRGSLSRGGTTFTDSSALFETNRFVNCILNVRSLETGNTVESFLVTGNSTNTITINGTWTVDSGTYAYVLTTPVLLGAVEEPWHRLYVGEDIRLGYGPSAGADVIWIKKGTGSPEGVVVANSGSIYLRKDGGASTSLYVKTSGDGTATGWTAK